MLSYLAWKVEAINQPSAHGPNDFDSVERQSLLVRIRQLTRSRTEGHDVPAWFKFAVNMSTAESYIIRDI